MSERLQASLAFCRRPVNMQLVTTDGPVPTRSNSFSLCTVFDPSDESKVVRRYKGPDTIRQFQAWKAALAGFPLLIQSYFCGTVVAARRVDRNGECHVC